MVKVVQKKEATLVPKKQSKPAPKKEVKLVQNPYFGASERIPKSSASKNYLFIRIHLNTGTLKIPL